MLHWLCGIRTACILKKLDLMSAAAAPGFESCGSPCLTLHLSAVPDRKCNSAWMAWEAHGIERRRRAYLNLISVAPMWIWLQTAVPAVLLERWGRLRAFVYLKFSVNFQVLGCFLLCAFLASEIRLFTAPQHKAVFVADAGSNSDGGDKLNGP